MTTPQAQPVTLMLCPFCGGEAELQWYDHPGVAIFYWVACTLCQVDTPIQTVDDSTPEGPIAAWNRRVESTALATAAARIRELEAELADEIIEVIGMREMYGYEDNDEARARYRELTGREYGKDGDDD